MPTPALPAKSPITGPQGGLANQFQPKPGAIGTTEDPAAATRNMAHQLTAPAGNLSSAIPPPPPGSPPPTTAKATGTKPSGGFLGFDPVGAINKGLDMSRQLTAPPLTQYTHHLGSWKGTADKALGWAQGMAQKNPGAMTSLAAMLPGAESLTGAGLGLPAALGLQAMIAGNNPNAADDDPAKTLGSDFYTFAKPLTQRLGL